MSWVSQLFASLHCIEKKNCFTFSYTSFWSACLCKWREPFNDWWRGPLKLILIYFEQNENFDKGKIMAVPYRLDALRPKVQMQTIVRAKRFLSFSIDRQFSTNNFFKNICAFIVFKRKENSHSANMLSHSWSIGYNVRATKIQSQAWIFELIYNYRLTADN